MLKHSIVIVAALSLVACTEDNPSSYSTTSSGTERATGSSSTTGTPSSGSLAESDRNFITSAASGGLYEVRAAELAQKQQGLDATEKQFAQMMIDDHGKANRQLKEIADRKGVPVSDTLQSKEQQMLDKLQGLKGDEFTREYHAQQVQAHDQTIALFEKESREAKDEDLRTFAQNTLPTLRKHRDHLQTHRH
jgi:putative membrane protein